MRKVFFMAAMLLVSAFGFAQPKMNVVGLPGLDVQYKRCVVNGNNCYFDFLLTNEAAEDMALLRIGGSLSDGYLYDDEGNIYKYAHGLASLTLGTYSSDYNAEEKMPRGVSIKFRIEFNNIDEYATVFKLLKIPACLFPGSSNWGYIEMRNIPIVRREQ